MAGDRLFGLGGKVAAVIGAGSGIGEAVACGCARQGATVRCLDVDLDAATEASPQRAHLEHLLDTMDRLASSHSFALTAGERLLGFLNVRDDRTPEAFSTYEIGLFAGLTVSMATVVGSCARKATSSSALCAMGRRARPRRRSSAA